MKPKMYCRIPVAGFSLLEVLVASVILTVIGIPMFATLSTGRRGTERIIEESVAAYIGSGLVEKLGRIPYSNLPELPDEVADFDLSEAFDERSFAPFIEPYPAGYLRSVSIQKVSKSTRDPLASDNSRWGELKMIRVRVSWKPDYLKGKSERTLVFQTLVTNDREPW